MASDKTNDTSGVSQACVDSANRLIGLCGLTSPRIFCISEINSALFVSLFEKITGHSIPDIVLDTDSIAEAHNVQAVIDTLSLDLIGLSLSHILGENVAAGDPMAVLNLLEVLETVFLSLFQAEDQKRGTTRTSSKKRKTPPSSESLSSTSVNSENVLPVKSSKARIRKRILKKLRPYEEAQVEAPCVPTSVDTIDACEHTWDSHRKVAKQNGTQKKSNQKKSSKPSEKSKKHLLTKNVERLYKSNFEKKLRNLMMEDQFLYPKCQQLKEDYLKSLSTPLKRKSIPVCRKSFLLPHQLRHSSKQQLSTKSVGRKSVSKSERNDSGTSKMNEERNETPAIIKCLLGEFPGFELPPHTQELMQKRYHHHLSHMHRQLRNTLKKKPTALKQAEEAEAKQTQLSNILSKDFEEKQYLSKLREERASAYRIRGGLRDARIRSAKIKQYFNEFHSSMRSKMEQRNFTEEMIVERAFKEMLQLQKEKVRLLCQRAKETDQQDARQHRQYLEALQHTYEQQLDLMAESLAAEQKEEAELNREKNVVARKMSRELRDKLQRDVRSLQKDVLELMRDTHFRELDAQNFIESIP